MLAKRAGCSQPQSIEQARQDFKIYMSKLLEHSAALDAFRPDARYVDVGDTESGGPAWGPPLNGLSEGGGSAGGTKGSPVASAALHTPSTSFSPSYFREDHAWPRAGAVTPPRPRPPPNFSWVAEPPTAAGGGVGEGSGGIPGRSLFLDSAPRLAPPSVGGGRRSEELATTARGRLGGGGVDDGDEWKAQWSRRLLRGPIHSEYQARFPWPPRSALKKTGASYAPSMPVHHRGRSAGSASNTGELGAESVSAAMASPGPQARSVSPLTRRGRGRGRADGGSTGSGARGEGGVDNLGVRGASEPPRGGRRTGAHPLTETPRSELHRPSPSGDAAVQSGGEEHGNGNIAVAGRSFEGLVGGTASAAAPAAAAASWVGPDQHVGKEEAPRVEAPAVEYVPLSDELGREVNAVERKWGAAGDEAWREQAVGRGEATITSGRETPDYSCQSIVTEYMDEFVWPSTLPVPGRRGKRTGMGVDHVARLLAGKRAEQPRRVLDPDIVARLGAAADGALKACNPAHLSEMCRLKSPSPACRRLVLGLVIALGLRWRRWSDIRSRLLGSKSELVGFLKRFDKNRSGLTSADLRPFAEEPSLSPSHVKRVAACLVWVSRWLRALHKYLAAKEGNLDVDIGAASLFGTHAASAVSLPRRASRRPHPSSHYGVHGAASGSAPEDSTPKTLSKERQAAAERRGRASGGSVAGDQRTQEAAKRPPSAAKEAPAEQAERRHAAATNDDESRDTRMSRRPSQAAATGGGGSSCPPLSTTTGGDVEERSRVGGERGGRVDEDEAAGVSFAGSSGDHLNSESQWTAGTVTSRGDVLGAPTDDQVDIGGGMDARQGEQTARTIRRRWNDGACTSSAGAPASVGGPMSSAAAAGVAGTTMTFHKALKGERGSSRRELSWGPQASHGCIYRHKQKARTPSRIAIPRARRPTRARKDPILANTRWPPPVVVRECDRTEQRSAFSLEHSFLAYE